MAKNWTTIETIYTLKNKPKTKAEQRRERKIFNKLMCEAERYNNLSPQDKRKLSVSLYTKNKAAEESLLKAYEDKKLKSEDAIKQAVRIKKERAKARTGAKQDKEKVSVTKETTDSVV